MCAILLLIACLFAVVSGKEGLDAINATSGIRPEASHLPFAPIIKNVDSQGAGRVLQQYNVPATMAIVNGLFFSAASAGYFAKLNVGGRYYHLLLDTGSELSWMQCQPCVSCYEQLDQPIFDLDAPSSALSKLSCDHPLCVNFLQRRCRPNGGGLCTYRLDYADLSFTKGVVVADTFSMISGQSFSGMAFGCSHTSRVRFDIAAGVLGLGGRPLSFPSQLRSKGYASRFSYCLPRRLASPNSLLTFGAPIAPDTVFTPLVDNPSRLPLYQTYYYVNLVGISVGGPRLTGVPPEIFQIDPDTGEGGTFIDSGSTLTTLPSIAYQELRDAFRDAVAANAPQLIFDGNPILASYDTCYTLAGGLPHKHYMTEPTPDIVYHGVPSVVFHFARGADLVPPPKNYLAPMTRHGSNTNLICLLFARSPDAATTLGNVLQQGFRFTFDIENGQLGFTRDAEQC
ncbi:hypothetical protein L7F22_056547 [Adiantum nelumboides]|nr:hypothetical protein [Adiantum nelumboides]